MGRRRTGWVREKHGKLHVGFTLRSGGSYEEVVPPAVDGLAIDEAYAHSVLNRRLRAYEAGTWDPEALPVEPALGGRAKASAYALASIGKQTYESQPKELTELKRYFSRSPIAAFAVADLRPTHGLQLIDWLKAQPSARGGRLGSRTIRRAYDTIQRAFDRAVIEEIFPINPFKVARKALPPISDKVPGARQSWQFSREEIAQILWSEKIAFVRRAVYAIAFITGSRPGENSALRFRDWDRTRQPLTCLLIERAIKSVSHEEGTTKTGAIKPVPVHPVVEKILTDWVDSGWQAMMGRAPKADDLLVPNQLNAPRKVGAGNKAFQRDLKRLGLRARHQYCMRHTFISLAQADGGDGEVLRWITHAPPRSAFDGYTRQDWGRLCAEVSKLKIEPPPIKAVVHDLGSGADEKLEACRIPCQNLPPSDNSAELQGKNLSGREDLNAPHTGTGGHEVLRNRGGARGRTDSSRRCATLRSRFGSGRSPRDPGRHSSRTDH